MPAPNRITAVLGFQKYRVVRFKRFSKEWIELWLEAREPNWRCPGCGQRFCAYYDRRWACLRDLDLAPHRTRLIIAKYRVACEQCGVRQVPTGISRERARCTKRFERWLFVLTRTMPVSEVSKVMEVDWEAVKDAEVRHIVGLLRKRDLDGIEELGIDEVSERKGHVG